MPPEVLTRLATPADAAVLAVLATELGYPSTEPQVAARLASLPAGDEIRVAVVDGGVVGWIHLTERRTLASDPFVEIDGLVVLERCRGLGIGRTLLALAPVFGRDRGLHRIVVRSNAIRERAHAFYLAAGYRELKRSLVFELDVG